MMRSGIGVAVSCLEDGDVASRTGLATVMHPDQAQVACLVGSVEVVPNRGMSKLCIVQAMMLHTVTMLSYAMQCCYCAPEYGALAHA